MPSIGKSDHVTITLERIGDTLPVVDRCSRPNIWKINFQGSKTTEIQMDWSTNLEVEKSGYNLKSNLKLSVREHASMIQLRHHGKGLPLL